MKSSPAVGWNELRNKTAGSQRIFMRLLRGSREGTLGETAADAGASKRHTPEA